MRLFWGLIIFAVLTSTAAVKAESSVLGEWLAANGKTRINIFYCDQEKLCSTITWLKRPRKDANNEDKSLRDRDLVGALIADRMKPKGHNRWVGKVYSPKKGKNFASTAKLSGDKLTIKGCLSRAGFLCKTLEFNRFYPPIETELK